MAEAKSDTTPSAGAAGRFRVVVNHEEQYAIWPAAKPIPEKWRSAGIEGSKQDCLDYIRRTWTDMRPLSVRRRHEADKAG